MVCMSSFLLFFLYIYIQDKILVYVVPLNEKIFEEIKYYIKEKDAGLPLLTQHPRYIRLIINGQYR